MKIKNVPGEFGFKALVNTQHNGWQLSTEYFFSLEEARFGFISASVKWPVEIFEDGVVYIPSPEELEND